MMESELYKDGTSTVEESPLNLTASLAVEPLGFVFWKSTSEEECWVSSEDLFSLGIAFATLGTAAASSSSLSSCIVFLLSQVSFLPAVKGERNLF